MRKLLSEEEVATYQRGGIVFPIAVLSKDETARFRDAYESFCEQLGSRPNAAQSRNPHLFHRWAYDLATHPRVLDAVEQIIGPNILVHHASLFCKYPHDGTFVSWHQDGYYLDLSEPLLVSAWIALSDSNVANGCMRVVRNSHQNGRIEHANSAISARNLLPSGLEIACEVDERDATDVVLSAGEMSLMPGWKSLSPSAARIGQQRDKEVDFAGNYYQVAGGRLPTPFSMNGVSRPEILPRGRLGGERGAGNSTCRLPMAVCRAPGTAPRRASVPDVELINQNGERVRLQSDLWTKAAGEISPGRQAGSSVRGTWRAEWDQGA